MVVRHEVKHVRPAREDCWQLFRMGRQTPWFSRSYQVWGDIRSNRIHGEYLENAAETPPQTAIENSIACQVR